MKDFLENMFSTASFFITGIPWYVQAVHVAIIVPRRKLVLICAPSKTWFRLHLLKSTKAARPKLIF